jgi:hypothetical protein
VEELLADRGLAVDQVMNFRWVRRLKLSVPAAIFRPAR